MFTYDLLYENDVHISLLFCFTWNRGALYIKDCSVYHVEAENQTEASSQNINIILIFTFSRNRTVPPH